MNTLSFPSISFPSFLRKAAQAKSIAEAAAAFKKERFPLGIESAEGSLTAIILAMFYQARPGTFLAAVP
ncbi:MAG: hypothetical protein LBG87_00210, partial [Spirochaetaceae bacterium]|nr:hypothetical protein [Spirochaetaceae bacterium]